MKNRAQHNLLILIFLSLFMNCTLSASFAQTQEEDPIIQSLPEEASALTSHEDFLIEGIVSPLTGQPRFQVVDLVAKGVENIVLSRGFISPYIPRSLTDKNKLEQYALYEYLRNKYQGWVYFPHHRLRVKWTSKGYQVRAAMPGGAAMDFLLNRDFSAASLIGAPFGLSNLGADGLSGKHDIRNTRISMQNDWETMVDQKN